MNQKQVTSKEVYEQKLPDGGLYGRIGPRDLKSKDFNISGKIPKFWDGKAAERIVEIITRQGT